MWGTDTPVIGPLRWQIEAFQSFTIPEAMVKQRGFQPQTPKAKDKIFGRDAARIFGIDIVAARRGVEDDLLHKLSDDKRPLKAAASSS